MGVSPEDFLKRLKQVYYRIEVELWHLFLDTVEAPEKIRQLGIKIGGFSNSRNDWMVAAVISRLWLDTSLDVVAASAELGVRKLRKEPSLKDLRTNICEELCCHGL